MNKLAIVTGANKGIGLGLVKALCLRHPDWTVYLTCRNKERGENALKELEKENICPRFHVLDIDHEQSVDVFCNYVKTKCQRIDVLVNNAAVLLARGSEMKNNLNFVAEVEATLITNYFSTLNFYNKIFPLLNDHARVVNVSSGAGHKVLSTLSEPLLSKYLNPTSVEELSQTLCDFLRFVKNGELEKQGYISYENYTGFSYAYSISKAGLTTLTPLLQAEMNNDKRKDLIINSCSPGYVATNMTDYKGPLTVEEGIDTLIYLAELPPNVPDNPKGDFLRKRSVVPFQVGVY